MSISSLSAQRPASQAAPTGGALGTWTPPSATGGTYTVKSGDNLSTIAQKQLGNESRWSELYDLNRDRVVNPNFITPGTQLRLPAGVSPQPVVSVPGDQLITSQSFNQPVQAPVATPAPYQPYGPSLSGGTLIMPSQPIVPQPWRPIQPVQQNNAQIRMQLISLERQLLAIENQINQINAELLPAQPQQPIYYN